MQRIPLIVVCAALLSMPALCADDDAKAGDESFYNANALYNRRLYSLAEKEYRRFLEKHPKHAKIVRARLGLGLSLYAQDKYEEAEPILLDLSDSIEGAEKAQVDVLLGQAQLMLKKPAEAEKTFTRAVSSKSKPDRLNALVGLVEALVRQKKWAEVVTRSEEALELEPKPAFASRVRFQGAMGLHRLERFAEAGKRLGELVESLDAKSQLMDQAGFLLAECLRETGELDKAAERYVSVSGGEGAFAGEALYRLGYVYVVQRRFDDAVKQLARYLKEHAEGERADAVRVLLGQAHVEKGDMEKAGSTLKPLVDRDPPHVEACLWMARSYSRDEHNADAIGVLRKGIGAAAADEPHLPALLFDSARAGIAGKQYAEALATLDRLLDGFSDWPQTADALRMKALCLHRTEQYEPALKCCEGFLKRFPKHEQVAAVAFMRAESCLMLKRDDDALKHYRSFAQKYKDDVLAVSARFRVAQLLHKKQEWEESLKIAATLEEKDRDETLFSQYDFIVGDAHFNMGNWDKAIEHLDSFRGKQKEAPNADAALLKLGLAFSRKDATKEATDHLTRLVSQHADSPHLSVALVELGRLAYEAKDYAGARGHLARALKGKLSDELAAQAVYYLGWAALGAEDDAQAEKDFSSLVQKYPKDSHVPDAQLQLGAIALRRDAFADAQKLLVQALAQPLEPGQSAHATFLLGTALARQGKHAEAGPHFEKLIAKEAEYPQRDQALYEDAWCKRHQEQFEAARKRYEALLAEHADSTLAERSAFELAELEFDADLIDAALGRLSPFAEKLKDGSLREQVLYRLGWCYSAKTNDLEAAKTFETLLSEFPKTRFVAQAAYQAGEARLRMKEHETARGHFEVAAGKRDDAAVHELALLRLGETQSITEQWPAAQKSYGEFLQLYPQSKWLRRAQLGIGWAMENQKEYKPAIEHYAKVLNAGKRDETAARAQFQMGECLFATGDDDGAISALMRVLVNFGFPKWSSKAMLEIGRVLEHKGEKDRALEQYESVVADFPDTDAAAVARERMAALKKDEGGSK